MRLFKVDAIINTCKSAINLDLFTYEYFNCFYLHLYTGSLQPYSTAISSSRHDKTNQVACAPSEEYAQPGPEVIKKITCSTQLSMKFFLLINVKMPTSVGISTFMSTKNSILLSSDPEKCRFFLYFHTYEHLKFHAQLS